MYVKAMVARFGSPTLFITTTMNICREEMRSIKLDTKNRTEDKFQPLDRPDLVAFLYSQDVNTFLRTLVT